MQTIIFVVIAEGNSEMADLIDRQAAIYIASGYCHPANIAKELAKLPSAEPEIIHCKECDWWEKQEDSLQGRCALLRIYPTGAWYCGTARRRPDER